jgi:hypothetical protein
VAPAAVEISGDDVAFMVYTSGTTGAPKAAMNTHRNVVFATTVYERWIGLTQADVILGLAPLFHVTGLIGHVTLAMLTGSPLLLFYRFEAAQALKLAQTHRATFTVSAVTGVHRAPQQRRDEDRPTCRDDQGVHRRGTDAARRAGRMARAHRRPHPADVRPDRGDVAHAHDAARTNPARGSAHGRHVGRRAGVQHRGARGHRRRPRRWARARSASC